MSQFNMEYIHDHTSKPCISEFARPKPTMDLDPAYGSSVHRNIEKELFAGLNRGLAGLNIHEIHSTVDWD